MSGQTKYLYEYKNGEQVRNLGFMKIEHSVDKCVLQIYGKDMDEIQGIIFRKPDGKIYTGSWEELLLEHEEKATEEQVMEVEEYISPSYITFEKISRQDLSRLPRREWRIANNSFLLHGFYNYHHLLYIEDQDEVWIGVPGIFHEKEKLAANTFGFPHFRRVADVNVELEEQEMNLVEDFGYWCRQIQNPNL